MDKESGGAQEAPPAEKPAPPAAEKAASADSKDDKPTAAGQERTGAAIIMEDDDSDEEPQSYNKLKFHHSKMDLNLRILREEVGHLKNKGNAISRQIASMYRTFQEMQDETECEGDEGDPGSDYDQYSNDDIDSQNADGRIDDGLDTEDDVNRMSDLETDSSSREAASKRKKQQKRPPPLQLDKPLQKKDNSKQDTNGNEIRRPASPPRNIVVDETSNDETDDIEYATNSDFYPDFETSSSDECSHCLCCSSLASYSSGMPWKYVDKSASSAAEYDSDSSEYASDSDDGPLESPMPIYKRLSPFFYQECYAEVEDEIPPPSPDDVGEGKEGGVAAVDGDNDSVPEKRMSPLGCESPRASSSRASSRQSLDDIDDSKDDGAGQENKDKAKSKTDKTVAAFKDKDSKQGNKKALLKSDSAKGKQLPQPVGKVPDIKDKAPKKPERKDKPLPKKVVDENMNVVKSDGAGAQNQAAECAPDASDDEDEYVPANVKDRMKMFEGQAKDEQVARPVQRSRSFGSQKSDESGPLSPAEEVIDKAKQDVLSELRKVVKTDKAKGLHRSKVKPPPPIKSKPSKSNGNNKDKPMKHVSKSTFRVKTPGDAEEGKRHHHTPHSSSTIEIPVQYLATPPGGQAEQNPPNALTFQVQPMTANMQGGPREGPFIITTSPKPKRKISKQVVQLTSPSDDNSERTLRPEPQGSVQAPTQEHAQKEHQICPHCHKKSIPAEERKRNVQVLQLQPVPEREIPATPITPIPQPQITFQAPPQLPHYRPARIIKVVPAGRQQMIMQRQPSEEPGSVHLRLNMPGQQQGAGVPIQIGDYIRIPLNRGQARGVRVIFS